MIYAQIKSGRKLHLVMQQGEVHRGHTMCAGELSNPICGQTVRGNYRMTINVPLANACKKCVRAYTALRARAHKGEE